MGIEGKLKELAQKCCNEVIDSEVPCCGMAGKKENETYRNRNIGDRGLNYPELNQSALKQLKDKVPQGCNEGYSTSRTCEIGLSHHSGVNFKSILYLLDDCTQKETPKTS